MIREFTNQDLQRKLNLIEQNYPNPLKWCIYQESNQITIFHGELIATVKLNGKFIKQADFEDLPQSQQDLIDIFIKRIYFKTHSN